MIIRISPSEIRYKISTHLDVRGVVGGDWDMESRVDITETVKYRSIVQRYVKGLPWEDTDMFRKQYPARFAAGDIIRGCSTLEALTRQYYDSVDALFEHLKANGFQARVNGEAVPIPRAYLARDGEVLMGNAGNHRVAMAKILGLDFVLVHILARHADLQEAPEHTAVADIPAMTTREEQRRYYRYALKAARNGAVIELGAWLGASTVWLAEAVRDSRSGRRVHVYDRFVWDRSHERKAPNGAPDGALEAFLRNVGDLRPFVDLHIGDIRKLQWTGGPIGMIVFDAPKRIPAISRVLTVFAADVRAGTILAWQDFGHFPSYEIVASLSRLEAAGNIKLVDAVFPGTTAVFKVRKPWQPEQVSESALAIMNWKPSEVVLWWERWAERLPEPMRACFRCGAALMLCDMGFPDKARACLRPILATDDEAMLAEWNNLIDHRPDLVKRYQPLMEELWHR